MSTAAKQTRENRTITVDFRDEAPYVQLLGDGQAFVECVGACLLSLGFQRAHTATCQGGGCLTRPSHSLRVRLGGVTIWRIQCTRCRAVCTVLPPCVWRYRPMRPEVARDALLATHGGLSVERWALLWPLSPMARSRLVCAFGPHRVVPVLTRGGLPLPPYCIAEEKPSRCLTDQVYRPTMVSGRVLWHLGYTEEASAAAFPQSYRELQRAAYQHEPTYRLRGLLPDGCDSTTNSMRTRFPGARLGFCLRHALTKLPKKLTASASPVRQSLRARCHALLSRARQRQSVRVVALGQRLRHLADHVAHTVGVAKGERVRRWLQEKKAGWYAVLADPQMPATSTLLEQAHNTSARQLCAMKGVHPPGGSPQAFLTGVAPLDNLIPYPRRAQHAGPCGVEVEGGTVPTRDWWLNLQILTSGGLR
jgi:hypothetical protein